MKTDSLVYAHHGESLLLSVEEAAALLHIGRTRMYELIAAGDVTSVKLGGKRLVPRDELEKFVRQLAAEQGGDEDA